MKILKRITVPTGDILIVEGEHGPLECLSLADYGKNVNIKCDALGLSREPSPVRHTALLPLAEKWVITISTQYGCSMGCNFCDVPKVGPGHNATVNDLIGQVEAAMSLHPGVDHGRINLHYARMGEPSYNHNVLTATAWLAGHLKSKFVFHPVVSTMAPQYHGARRFVREWVHMKNDLLKGEAGLQLSINSTNEEERRIIFGGHALMLGQIADMMHNLRPVGRKFTLNFAVADWEIDPDKLRACFDPAHYLIKLTPMHQTTTAQDVGLATRGDPTAFAPYRHHEAALRRAGYDVLVFIASREEDESKITCGNAILAERS